MELVEEADATVIFNLEDIHFIDTAGFDVLLEVSDRARELGSSFSLCNITSDVKELILLLELKGSFSFVSLEDTGEKILLVLD